VRFMVSMVRCCQDCCSAFSASALVLYQHFQRCSTYTPPGLFASGVLAVLAILFKEQAVDVDCSMSAGTHCHMQGIFVLQLLSDCYRSFGACANALHGTQSGIGVLYCRGAGLWPDSFFFRLHHSTSIRRSTCLRLYIAMQRLADQHTSAEFILTEATANMHSPERTLQERV
jgi:hypothetical protein